MNPMYCRFNPEEDVQPHFRAGTEFELDKKRLPTAAEGAGRPSWDWKNLEGVAVPSPARLTIPSL